MNTTLFAASSAMPLHCLVPAGQTEQKQTAPVANTSLHGLVSGLVQSFLPLTIDRHSLILNEVPRDLRVGVDEDMLAYILWSLINGAIQSTRDQCIHIEAAEVCDRLVIRIKDLSALFHHAIAREFRQVQHVAENLGGTISIENGRLILLLAHT